VAVGTPDYQPSFAPPPDSVVSNFDNLTAALTYHLDNRLKWNGWLWWLPTFLPALRAPLTAINYLRNDGKKWPVLRIAALP
jgi:hypothetical protein